MTWSKEAFRAKMEAKLRLAIHNVVNRFEKETHEVMDEMLEEVVYSYTDISMQSLLARRKENGGLKDHANRDVEIFDTGRLMVFQMRNNTDSQCLCCDDLITGIIENGYGDIPPRKFMEATQKEMNKRARIIVMEELLKVGLPIK